MVINLPELDIDSVTPSFFVGGQAARLVEVTGPRSARVVAPALTSGNVRVTYRSPEAAGGADLAIRSPEEHSSLEQVLQTPAGRSLTDEQKQALLDLQAASDGELRLHVNPVTGTPVWVSLRYPVSSADSAQNAEAFLRDYGSIFRIDELGQLVRHGDLAKSDCCTHVRFAQQVGGVPVYAGGLEILEDRRAWISEIRGTVFPQIPIPDDPTTTDQEAIQALEEEVPLEVAELEGRLCLLDDRLSDSTGTASLTWHFALPSDTAGFLTHWFVDANNGTLLAERESSVAGLPPGTQASDCIGDWTSPIYHVNERTGAPDFVSWHHAGGLYVDTKGSTKPEAVVYEFLRTYPTLFGDGDPLRHQPIVEVIRQDSYGFSHVRTRQHYADLPVFGVGLRYRIAPGNRLWSISGNYLPQLSLNVTPEVSASGATSNAAFWKAENSCPGCSKQETYQIADDLSSAAVGPAVLGVLPTSLAQPPTAQPGARDQAVRAELAYRVEFPASVVFVNAHDGEVVFSYSLQHTHGGHGDINIYDADGSQDEDFTNLLGGIDVEVSDPGDPGADPEVAQAFQRAHRVLDYWYRRHDLFPDLSDYVMDNEGRGVHLIVDADWIDDQGNSECPNAYHRSMPVGPDHMVFCTGEEVGDIIGHEMTHGVTDHSSGLIYADESGALNEHYSDLFGNLVFPDAGGGWQVGETKPSGAVRDMANPSSGPFGDPDMMQDYKYPSQDCIGNYDDPKLNCDHGGVHSNCGIPNKAIVLLSDGIPGLSTGIGRDAVAAISFWTLVNYLEEWSGFTDHMLGTKHACDFMLGWGFADTIADDLRRDDCDQIPNAFNQVGIPPSTSTGWHHSTSGAFGSDSDYTEDHGDYTDACTVGGYILKLWSPEDLGMRFVCSDSSICDTVSNEIDYQGEYGVRVESWSEGQHRRRAKIHQWQTNFENVVWSIEFVPDIAAGGTVLDCEPAWTVTRTGGTKKHWSDLGFPGDKSNDVVGGSDMPAGCRVTGVRLEKVDKYGEVMGHTGWEVGNSHSGARIVDDPIGTNSRKVEVHWWYDPFNIIRYRVVYSIDQPQGVTCWP